MSWFPHRTTLVALAGAVLVACSGVQVPQARVHSDEEIHGHLRAHASEDLSCPTDKLRLEEVASQRYRVRGCDTEVAYCCYERTLEVFCERAPQQPRCNEPPLSPPPTPQRYQPQSAEDYGVIEH
ncbi:MAG: hypothetical protein OXU20_16265 [Myxococcales bacterium]|nr:hypothetical protein [Myxococcales bacterium]